MERGDAEGAGARVLEGRVLRALGERGSGSSAKHLFALRTYKAEGSENVTTATGIANQDGS